MDPLQPGDPEQVGSYRLVGRLGAGGMGQVFLGRTPGGRPVVVKVIRLEHAEDPAYRARFAREAEAARRVGGFHTAQVVDADPGADPPWMATAHIRGPSLHQAVREHGSLDADSARALAAGLAEGLAAIHACDLVHRDLKPGNIILADDGPRIIDFGIARSLDASTMTSSGAVLGTLSYMSPEQVEGRRVGPASDVFSLGSVLAFAATGRSPFAANSMAAVVYRITRESPNLAQVPDHVLGDVIGGCLDKDPARRPALADLIAEWGDPHRPPDTGGGQASPPTFPAWEALKTLAEPDAEDSGLTQVLRGESTVRGSTEAGMAAHAEPAAPPGQPRFVVCFVGADADYGARLAAHLSGAGLPVWSGEERGEDYFWRVRQQLQDALAVLIVMSPDAQESEDITRVILEGQRRSREFFPVLLRGQRHYLLASTWYFDARGGALPGSEQLGVLSGLQDRTPTGSDPSREPARLGALPQPPTRAGPSPAREASLNRLRTLLTDGEVQHADLLTTTILLDAADRRESGWLRRRDGNRLSLDLLADVDALWAGSSAGAYGFRAQRARAPAGSGRYSDFLLQAVEYGWQNSGAETMPAYQDFIGRAGKPAFYPTLRNPQNERYPDWYDQWAETVRAVHLRIHGWEGPE